MLALCVTSPCNETKMLAINVLGFTLNPPSPRKQSLQKKERVIGKQ